MTFLPGSAKADAQNATESVTAVHRANQPNLLNILMEAILPLFSFRGKRNRQLNRRQSAGAGSGKGVDRRLRDQNDRIMVKSLAGCEGAEDAEKTDVIFIVEKCCNIDELASCDLLKRARAVFPRDDS